MQKNKISENTRWLLISVFKRRDNFFRNIYAVSEKIKQIQGFAHYLWKNETLNLYDYKQLQGIIISGHGSQKFARISDCRKQEIVLIPEQLKLPEKTKLFFLLCNQGKEFLKYQWRLTLNIPEGQIFGLADVSEITLSILFLLQILENPSIDILTLFRKWVKINNTFRPNFENIILTYAKSFLNYNRAFKILDKSCRFSELYPDFFKLRRKYARFLNGIRK